MTISNNLRNRYEAMDTDQLSELYVSGGLTGLTENAEEILYDVLKERGVVPEELLLSIEETDENVTSLDGGFTRIKEKNKRNNKLSSVTDYPNSANYQSSGNTFLYLSSALMVCLGIFVCYTLISKANTGWGGIDEKLIIMGIGVLIYQSIIAYLCYKVADLEDRLN